MPPIRHVVWAPARSVGASVTPVEETLEEKFECLSAQDISAAARARPSTDTPNAPFHTLGLTTDYNLNCFSDFVPNLMKEPDWMDKPPTFQEEGYTKRVNCLRLMADGTQEPGVRGRVYYMSVNKELDAKPAVHPIFRHRDPRYIRMLGTACFYTIEHKDHQIAAMDEALDEVCTQYNMRIFDLRRGHNAIKELRAELGAAKAALAAKEGELLRAKADVETALAVTTAAQQEAAQERILREGAEMALACALSTMERGKAFVASAVDSVFSGLQVLNGLGGGAADVVMKGTEGDRSAAGGSGMVGGFTTMLQGAIATLPAATTVAAAAAATNGSGAGSPMATGSAQSVWSPTSSLSGAAWAPGSPWLVNSLGSPVPLTPVERPGSPVVGLLSPDSGSMGCAGGMGGAGGATFTPPQYLPPPLNLIVGRSAALPTADANTNAGMQT
ncbi:hypothetical protein HYH02_015330 [Chlamydomonas schloesseri]|uniref:Uncharacterized protein n=1 Tax=Chlamydomonas schloesseri TaxID=2026947 RepID=A0A835VNI2_9CHLO|nr:hypothetical protein HYH02_015330 [Chlamydomonas schloesseri]|eukprot:KAG2423372.1 hypothetical protein HYH02_015330 [Chlamydomonas schloesseri]